MIPADVANLLKEIIEIDCTGSGFLRSGDGEFCFIGGLYACIDPDWAISTRLIGSLEATRRLRCEIELTLGLTKGTLIGAFETNDLYRDITTRRRALHKWVEGHTEAGE